LGLFEEVKCNQTPFTTPPVTPK